MPVRNPPPLDGKVIQGRWRLIKKLGEGGMGAVYLAEQLSIRGRRVAVKLLRPEFAQDSEFLRRFRGEAERAAAVSDPRIVTVLDFGQAETGDRFS
jgi:serine/threonine protein kinase